MIHGSDKNIGLIGASAHDSIIVRPNTQTLKDWPGAAVEPRSQFCVIPKNNNCVLNQTIQGGEDRSFFELGIVIVPEVIKLGDQMFTKTLTISAKYVFINETSYKLTLIQH